MLILMLGCIWPVVALVTFSISTLLAAVVRGSGLGEQGSSPGSFGRQILVRAKPLSAKR